MEFPGIGWGLKQNASRSKWHHSPIRHACAGQALRKWCRRSQGNLAVSRNRISRAEPKCEYLGMEYGERFFLKPFKDKWSFMGASSSQKYESMCTSAIITKCPTHCYRCLFKPGLNPSCFTKLRLHVHSIGCLIWQIHYLRKVPWFPVSDAGDFLNNNLCSVKPWHHVDLLQNILDFPEANKDLLAVSALCASGKCKSRVSTISSRSAMMWTHFIDLDRTPNIWS